VDIVINKDSYYIPTKWAEVSLGKYMQFMANYNEEATETQKEIVLLSAFTGVPLEKLEQIKKQSLDKAVAEISKLFEKPANKDLNLIVEIDGIEYGLHPNLSELKLKEFVDLDMKLEGGWEAMDEVMSILYRPVTDKKKGKYKIEDYDYRTATKRALLFKDNLSIDTVNGAAAFFLTIGIDYIQITQAYSKTLNSRAARRKASKQMKNSLMKSMGGTV
tara:strand:+ start:1566 stop:2219 length:654 start_codon:yes stop_codon:yes gene_type:complete